MEEAQVCLGCFSEWEEGWHFCPHCGWEAKRHYSDMLGWTTGDVLDKRYLLGMQFTRVRNMVIWRIYDHFLGISCFVLRTVSEKEEELAAAAGSLQAAGEDYRVLAVKTIGNRKALLFSAGDYFMKPEILEKVLLQNADSVPASELEEEYKKEAVKKEQALPPGTQLAGRYQVIRAIGIGGFGITYLCEDLFLHRAVAVKEYFPAQWAERDGSYAAVKQSSMLEAYRFGMQSFLKEARITARFLHTPHVISMYEVLYANDTIYLVMEYISGISIGREMRGREYKPYTPEEAAKIILPVLEALEEIHREKIVHSDISPGNIMRSDKNEICLIDMGASKYFLESQPVLSAAFLKPDYAAPEQYRTAREGIPKDEGPWTDIYAAGATLYYLLTGHKATDALNRLSGTNTELVPPKKYKVKISKKWMEIIRHAMALEIDKRIHSSAVFREEIRLLLK